MYGLGGPSGRAAEKETLRRVHEVIAARMSGDAEAFLKFFVEDVELRGNCQKLAFFPAGRWSGHDALRETLRRADIAFEPLDAEVLDVLVEGDRAAVRWRGSWRRRANNAVLCRDLAHFLRWRNGRVAEMDEFIDHRDDSRFSGVRLRSFAEMLDPPPPCLSREEMARRLMALGNFSSEGPDIDLFRIYCAADVVSEFVGDPATIFYAGRHCGVDALTSIIRAINIDFEQVGATPSQMIVDGGAVAARRTVEWRHRGTGRRGVVELADFIRFENGRIVELVEFRDTVALMQMQG
ncbi:nuclear transport factor 2 family protein [Methylocystis sp. IM3]|jgi:ketosteroid isomerase-like protein|uniref:nuclear transport factor 2 family protein n=1 Tax=unclassified Methylocystis TaxID=2625913 RepID=UPI000F9B802E|nr:MAG: nuclear transport factor 2 family protein [Hyphomicrobiales bacterium]